MKVVIVAHYFPPLNSTGARRMLALGEHLIGRGHEVSVITTHKSSADGPLTEKIPRNLRILEVGLFRIAQLTDFPQKPKLGNPRGLRRGESLRLILTSIKRAIMRSLGSLFDHRLLLAIFASTPRNREQLAKLLYRADVIVSSSPPWPVHIVGRLLSSLIGSPWIADYRDQFSCNHAFPGNSFTRHLERWIERWILKSASAVCVISGPMKEYYRSFERPVFEITNGYDATAIAKARSSITVKSDSSRIVIRSMGTITKDRIPDALFRAIESLPPEIRLRLTVEFFGEVRLAALFQRAKFSGIGDQVKFYGIVPYDESLRLILSSDALYLKETSSVSDDSSRGVLTTKLFEYLAAEKPIVAEVSPETLIAGIVARSGLGIVCSQDYIEIKKAMAALIERRSHVRPDREFIGRYSRSRLCEDYERLLNSISSQGSRRRKTV